jgi:WD40 repeat protein
LAISPDGRLLAIGFSWGAPLQVWDLTTKRKIREFEVGIASIDFTAGGNQLALGEWEMIGRTRVVEIESGEFLTTGTNAVSQVFGVASYAGGKWLATATGQSIHLWEQPGLKKLAVLRGHEAGIHAMTYSPVADLLASASLDGTIRLWRANPSAHTNHTERPLATDLFEIGQTRPWLCSVTTNNWLQLWDVVDGREIPRFAVPVDPEDTERFANQVQCSPDGSIAAYGTTNGQVHIYDCTTGLIQKTILVGVGDLRVGAIAPDNKTLLICNNIGSLREKCNGRLWNWQTNEEEASLPELSTISILPGGAFSPDGRLLAYAADYTVHVWDRESGRVRWKLEGHGWVIRPFSFSHDGRLLATSSFDGTTRIWDVATGQPAVPTLKGESSSAWFTRDGRTLVTCYDQSVRFWSVATGQELLAVRHANWALLTEDETTLLLWRARGVSQMRIPTLAEIDAGRIGAGR